MGKSQTRIDPERRRELESITIQIESEKEQELQKRIDEDLI